MEFGRLSFPQLWAAAMQCSLLPACCLSRQTFSIWACRQEPAPSFCFPVPSLRNAFFETADEIALGFLRSLSWISPFACDSNNLLFRLQTHNTDSHSHLKVGSVEEWTRLLQTQVQAGSPVAFMPGRKKTQHHLPCSPDTWFTGRRQLYDATFISGMVSKHSVILSQSYSRQKNLMKLLWVLRM